MPAQITLQCTKCSAQVTMVVTEGPVICPRCGTLAAHIRNIPGYVYILSNPQMPGLLKIGITTRSVPDRVAELSSATGVPAPFSVEAYLESNNPEEDERAIHQQLADFRIAGREFFRVTLEQALNTARTVTHTEPAGLESPGPRLKSPTAGSWSSMALWRCPKCSAEFESKCGFCPGCGSSSYRLNWGRE